MERDNASPESVNPASSRAPAGTKATSADKAMKRRFGIGRLAR